MTEPFLHLGDVGLVIERVGGRGRAQRMRADQKPKLPRIAPHQTIDAVRSDRALQPAGVVVADRPEQRAGLVEGMPDGVEIVVDQAVGAGMQRQIPRLAAFAGLLSRINRFPAIRQPYRHVQRQLTTVVAGR